ncbi:MAG: hypothetical protein AAF411_18525 [Myxococcota bacterium]
MDLGYSSALELTTNPDDEPVADMVSVGGRVRFDALFRGVVGLGYGGAFTTR